LSGYLLKVIAAIARCEVQQLLSGLIVNYHNFFLVTSYKLQVGTLRATSNHFTLKDIQKKRKPPYSASTV
jgi:hypothetical protein